MKRTLIFLALIFLSACSGNSVCIEGDLSCITETPLATETATETDIPTPTDTPTATSVPASPTNTDIPTLTNTATIQPTYTYTPSITPTTDPLAFLLTEDIVIVIGPMGSFGSQFGAERQMYIILNSAMIQSQLLNDNVNSAAYRLTLYDSNGNQFPYEFSAALNLYDHANNRNFPLPVISNLSIQIGTTVPTIGNLIITNYERFDDLEVQIFDDNQKWDEIQAYLGLNN